jgi:hypothetical protein
MPPIDGLNCRLTGQGVRGVHPRTATKCVAGKLVEQEDKR